MSRGRSESTGERYDRLIRRDGKPLSPRHERAEQEKLDKETNKRKQEPAEAKARRLKAAQRETLACNAEFADGFRFRLLGVESVNGRRAWKVEAEPIPGGPPRCEAVRKIRSFRLPIWVAQEEPQWARLEGDNIAPVTWGAILIRAPAGAMHIAIDSTRRDDGAWLPAHAIVRAGAWLPAHAIVRAGAGVVLMAKVRLEIESTFSDYRKFQSESKVLE